MHELPIAVFGDKAGDKEYKERPAVYALIVNERNEVAVVQSRGRLLLPGGGMEGDETRQECLERECAEELGYDIAITSYIGCAVQYLISFLTGEPMKISGYFYRADLVRPNGRKSEPDHELVWLPPEEAAPRMFTEFAGWAIRHGLA